VNRAARNVIGDMSGIPTRTAMNAPLHKNTKSRGKAIFTTLPLAKISSSD